MTEMVDFRDQISCVVGDLKWMEDMCRYEKPTPEQLLEFADFADRAIVVIRLLIKVGLVPHGLWDASADALWIRPANEWPKEEAQR